MKSNRLLLPAAALAAMFLNALPAAGAALFTGLYAFGDSLTDTGNTSLATGGALPGAAYYNGRYSNGPVWLERLAGHLGLAAPTPSLAGGRDFAFAGAYTQTGGQVPTIAQQAGMFTGAGGTFLPSDLVVVWGGPNDFLLGGQMNPAIPATNIAGVISTLAGAGARNFLVPNLPDLGDTPELLSTNNSASILGASAWTQGFNSSLFSQVDSLGQSLGVTVFKLDVYGIGKSLKGTPVNFGFSNTTQSALLTGNAANAADYLYWDTVHPTAGVHEIFGWHAYYAVPEPGSGVFLMVAGAILCRMRLRGVRGTSTFSA